MHLRGGPWAVSRSKPLSKISRRRESGEEPGGVSWWGFGRKTRRGRRGFSFQPRLVGRRAFI
jgi:hypothetical protein